MSSASRSLSVVSLRISTGVIILCTGSLTGVFFLATIAMEMVWGIDLTDMLGLHYIGASDFRPFQLVTYMFMHGSFAHLFFNMFALWMFGNTLENYWGGKKKHTVDYQKIFNNIRQY